MRVAGGFSLLEMVVALAILTVGLVAVLGASQQSTRQDAMAELIAAVETNLRGRLDVLATEPFDELAAWAAKAPGEIPLGSLALPPLPDDMDVQDRAWATVLEDGLIVVDLEATWRLPIDSRSQVRRIRIARIVARQDLSLGVTHEITPQP